MLKFCPGKKLTYTMRDIMRTVAFLTHAVYYLLLFYLIDITLRLSLSIFTTPMQFDK